MLLPRGIAVQEAERLLREWLVDIDVQEGGRGNADLLVTTGQHVLVVELKQSGDAAAVARAAAQALAYAKRHGKRALPVVVTPFMGETGKQLCAQAGVSWFDLSGNASIKAPGLRILSEGKPNRFVRRGRPSSAFAPKSARIARHLLIDAKRFIRQQDLAAETGLDDGYTSRIVRRLEADKLLARDKEGAVRPRDPSLLLDSWSEAYDFEKHHITRGIVTARAGDELLQRLSDQLGSLRVRHAATGLAAAWLHTAFAGFRLVTLFVESLPAMGALTRIGFREQAKGSNVWLVVPNDEGVFDGVSVEQSVACVHPVQALVDLQAQPERAAEAAAELRSRTMPAA